MQHSALMNKGPDNGTSDSCNLAVEIRLLCGPCDSQPENVSQSRGSLLAPWRALVVEGVVVFHPAPPIYKLQSQLVQDCQGHMNMLIHRILNSEPLLYARCLR